MTFSAQVSSPAQGVKELEERLGLTLRGSVEGTTTVPTHLALPLDSLAAFLRSHLHLQAQGETRFPVSLQVLTNTYKLNLPSK